MRVAILDCCCPNPSELAHFPSVGKILLDWLSPHLEGAELSLHDIWGGEPVEKASGMDAYVVSGSESGVYDDRVWMPPLRDFLNGLRQAGKPMLGICFGHQLMADTFGGKAELATSGYAAGAARFQWGDRAFNAFVLHGDQVTEVPPGAQVFCHAPHCAVGGLAYDFPALSFQFHPEYERDYVDLVTGLLRGDRLDDAQAETALQSTCNRSVAYGLLAREAADFLKSRITGIEFVAQIGARS